jgi:uncharacterized protein
MFMKFLLKISILALALPVMTFADVSPEWINKVTELAPAKMTVRVERRRRVLMFSLATGYQHKVIPHASAAMQVLADKTGVATLTLSNNINAFSQSNLAQYDALIINNTCSDGKERHLFRDVLIHQFDKKHSPFKSLTLAQRTALAKRYEKSFMDFVAKGKGLMVLHGAITMLNNTPEAGNMIGASFDYHPPFQKITLSPAEPSHPLLQAFSGKKYRYEDEPYMFTGVYEKYNFRPLLILDTRNLKASKKQKHRQLITDKPRYMAWVKPYHKGRVFYVAPGHSEKTYERAEMLQFYLDGLQYVLGDMKVDDSVSM